MPTLAFLAVCAIGLGTLGCPGRQSDQEPRVTSAPRSIEAVLAEHSPRIMALPGVVAVGQGALPDGTPCVRVYLKAANAETERQIPKQIEGHPVVVEVSGEIRALPDSGS